MTKALMERIGQSGASERDLVSALNFICGTLVGYDAANKGTSPFDRLDVERVFAAVEMLAERRDLEVTPFVASWLPAVDAWDISRGPSGGFFDRDLQRALFSEHPGFNKAESLITGLIQRVAGAEATGETYKALARRMLDDLRALLMVTQKKLDYLMPLIEWGASEGGRTIATLNYDLAIEGAAEARGVPVSTGIRDWIAAGRWAWEESGIRLLKLHGSIDWAWIDLPGTDGELPRKVVSVEAPASESGDPVLVFGQRGKLRAEGPFLSLLAEFESQLATAARLIVIGYSFRDDHVNAVIRKWLGEDAERTVLVVDPVWPTPNWGNSGDFRVELARHLVPPDWKPASFERRLAIWPIRCGEALRELARVGFDGEGAPPEIVAT